MSLIGYGGNACLLRPGHKRWRCFHLVPLGSFSLGGSRLPCCEDTQASVCEEQRPPAASHMRAPSWKGLLQPQVCLQTIMAPTDILTAAS